MAYSSGNNIRAADYNALAGLTSTAAADASAATAIAGYLYGVGFGDRGYGQTSPALTAHSAGTKVPAWSDLRTVLSNLCAWNGTSTTNLPSADAIGAGAPVVVTSIPALLTSLDTNRLNYDVGNMTLTSNAASSTRAKPWGYGGGDLTCEFSITFASENAARYFFNTGGQLRIALEHSDTSTTQDTNWHDILDNLVVAFKANESERLTGSTGSATNVGYYDLTTEYQAILDGTNAGSGAYSANDYLVEAKALSQASVVNGSKGSVIWFRVVLTDQHSNSFYDSVKAGTKATLSHLRAGSVLSALPAAPTCAVETEWRSSTGLCLPTDSWNSESPTWTNITNAYAKDGVFASASATGGNETGYNFFHTFGGLAVPPGATINGIELHITARLNAGTYSYSWGFLHPAGVADPWTRYSTDSLVINTMNGTLETHVVGGPTSLWGNTTTGAWAASDFTSTLSVGMAFAGVSSITVNLDAVAVRVYYTPA